jgi:acetylornithine deacetylase/succinyl-diaminopimelate desuccinylase-like protein
MNLNQQDHKALEELKDLLRFPSVSTDSTKSQVMQDCATWLVDRLDDAGATKAEILPTAGIPAVYAERIIDPSLKTILVYGHYDVQPEDPVELWDSPPFEPEVKDGAIYARGATDDKGQMYLHVKAMQRLNEIGYDKANIKFLIEGEEEIGSPSLDQLLTDQKDLLKADLVLVSDTAILSPDQPSITVGLRGMNYFEVEVEGPNRDLHSGVYGGAVPNPINALCAMVAKLHDEQGRVTIPGFYDDVADLSPIEKESVDKAMELEGKAFLNDIGLKQESGEKGFNAFEKTSVRPTCDINGIWGGYTGEGSKTVIPSKAFAKISMRLVANQDQHRTEKAFVDYFPTLAPEGIKVTVKPHHGAQPYVTGSDTEYFKSASAAFEKVWGKTPLALRGGGSIPVVVSFKKILGIDTLLMGFGLDSDALHSPNEHFQLDHYFKGIETVVEFYKGI